MEENTKNIRVVVRVRPFNRRELEQNQRAIIKVVDDRQLLFDPDEDEDEFFFHGCKQMNRDITKRVNKKLSMEFDKLFDWSASNDEIFNACTKPLVSSVMDGYNCSVFVYGATGAGKTHTMLGNIESPGITFLTMKELFEHVKRLSDERKFNIGISYLEVYNEQVMNLLTKSGPLKLREDSNGVVVGGLSLIQINSAEDLLNLLELGNKNRTQHPTDSNAESSRSHAVFQVHIRMIDKRTSEKRTVKLSLIDLAGSERAASTKCIGLRFKEGASINKSLLALGNCINKLADGLKHIPYRDSNLTRILKDSLGGNCQTLMIANISPSSLTYEDTYNTLKYASRAKKIRIHAKQNIISSNLSKEYFIKKVNQQQIENDRLKALIKQFEQKMLQNVAEKPTYNETELENWYKRIDIGYMNLQEAQEHYLTMLSKEKILKIRIKIKEDSENTIKLLQLDTGCEDVKKLEASIDRFGKQLCKQKCEIIKWVKIYRNAQKELDLIRKGINKDANLEKMLGVYIKEKEMAILTQKFNLKAYHASKINIIYHTELEQWRKTLSLSCEIIEQSYLLLNAGGQIDTELRDKLNKLVKMCIDQYAVKFDDDKSSDVANLNHMHLSDSINDDKNVNTKRTKLEIEDDEEITGLKEPIKKLKTNIVNSKRCLDLDNVKVENNFLAPSSNNFLSEKKNTFDNLKNTENKNTVENDLPIHNLNETTIKKTTFFEAMDGVEEIDYTKSMNSTFLLDKDTNKANLFKGGILKRNILTEHNSNREQKINKVLKDVPIKSNLLTKVIGVSKENRKFSPNRINKLTVRTNRGHSPGNALNRQRTKSNTIGNRDNTDSARRIRLGTQSQTKPYKKK